MDRHESIVADISTSVRGFYDRREPFRIYHGSTNSTRPSPFKHGRLVDTSRLDRVLEIDRAYKTVVVEPNVPMDALVRATLPFGLIPPVVMEFPGITVGGGFAGTSGESSSFKYGFFDRTIFWMEMVLATGEIVTVSASEKPDLFHGAAGSFGTLGVTTLLKIRLIDARTYVEVTYQPVFSAHEAIEKLKEASNDFSNDYVDGIQFTLDHGVVMTGRLTDTLPQGVLVQSLSRPRDPWFYRHVEKLLNRIISHPRSPSISMPPIVEAIPIVDYLFRYDRGGFWVGRYAFQYFMVPFNRVTRWILNPFMHTRTMYHALHESGHAHRYILQDLGLPVSASQRFLEYLDRDFHIYPLWLCPIRQFDGSPVSMHPHSGLASDSPSPVGRGSEPIINVGLWGPGSNSHSVFVKVNRSLERKVRELGGVKWLYGLAYYTEAEFWSIYDRDWYQALRKKYHAETLPSIYDKVKTDPSKDPKKGIIWSIWPLTGLYGVAKCVLGKDYLLAAGSRRKHRSTD